MYFVLAEDCSGSSRYVIMNPYLRVSYLPHLTQPLQQREPHSTEKGMVIDVLQQQYYMR